MGKDLLELVDHQHQSFFAILRQQSAGDQSQGLRFLGKVRTQSRCRADRFGLARQDGSQCIQGMCTRGKRTNVPLAAICGRQGTIHQAFAFPKGRDHAGAHHRRFPAARGANHRQETAVCQAPDNFRDDHLTAEETVGIFFIVILQALIRRLARLRR